MPYRLIAVDLDGTILEPDHSLSRSAAEAIAACRELGARVLVATGRSYASAAPYVAELGLLGPQITLNGAVIADVESGELEAGARLTTAQVALVIAELSARRIPHVVFGRDRIYAERGTPGVPILEEYGEPPPIWLAREELLHHPEPIKILISSRPGPLDTELNAALGGHVEVIRTSQLFFEFLPMGVGKGTALEVLMARFGVPRDEVLAIGDGENDLSMFAAAGRSVAMGQAPLGVRAAASEITASLAEGGAALALRRLVLGEG
jgi:Cof subfamily protein (haloacid dehalogenase superfamily)